ncbi:MAG: hypothetical protein ACLUIR_08950 [Faecalibacterium prausnitzii]
MAKAKRISQFLTSPDRDLPAGRCRCGCAFDDKAIENGPFAGVEGVGAKGYPYFRNRCFVMARKGTGCQRLQN